MKIIQLNVKKKMKYKGDKVMFKNTKLWINANFHITDWYDEYMNSRWIESHKNDILPIEIEIETLNRCNGTCPFCPVNVNMPQRERAEMTINLFHKIIDELSDLDYGGKISLYSNNEPLLDNRIIEFHRYAKEKLPKAYFSLFTNGSLLNVEKLQELTKYLDSMVIDNYNDNFKVNDSLREVYAYLQKHDELKNKVNFSMRKQNVILYSRGGQAPNKKNARPRKAKCLLPFRQMVIRPDGKVSLCCNDALGKYTLGNLNENSIQEIWSGERYIKIRKEMQINGRKNLNLCKNCDSRVVVY